MKKIITLGLTAVMLITLMFSVSIPAFAANEQEENWEISVLAQMGLLDNTEPASDVSKKTLSDGLTKLFGNEMYSNTYFAGQDLSKPLLCGQAAMILVDILGYTDKMKLSGMDTKDANAYMSMAVQLKIISGTKLKQYDVLTVEQYARIFYNAIAKTAPMQLTPNGYTGVYETLKNTTLLSSCMNIKMVQGIVYGADAYSITGGGPESDGYINIGGIVYTINDIKDRNEYIGKFVKAYIDDENNNVCAIVLFKNNEIVKFTDEDVKSASESQIEYYEGNRKKTARLSDLADVIYNRELLTSYSAEDFKIPDSEYTLIDNNNDSKYEVVLIEHYTSKLVEEVAYTTGKILLKDGEIIDINDYYDSGYKLYNAEGSEMDFSVLSRSQVLSYLEARSGEYTYMASSSDKVTGTLKSIDGDKKHITIDDKEYLCTEEYIKNAEGNSEIKVGDRITASLDVTGKIIDITIGATGSSVGYLINCWQEESGECSVRIIDEKGQKRDIPLKNKISTNRGRVSGEELINNIFTENGEINRQLILYNEDGSGKIASIETAEDKSSLGSRGNTGFTLDYDFKKEGELRVLQLNGKKIMGSKYVVRDNTVVFSICTNDLNESYVQMGDSIPTLTGLNVKLYNVNDDYDVQYIVREFTREVGGWVDFWGDTYMVDKVYQTINEDDEPIYAVELYTPSGKKKTALMEDGTITTNEWNIMSGDKSLSQIQAKDLKRGMVVEINEDFHGLTGIAIQHAPKADGNDWIFEAIDSATGNEYGLNEKTFNGGYLMSYGEVIQRTRTGIIVNNHIPNEDEQLAGETFPMDKWNRTIPLNITDKVIVYDKTSNRIEVDTAACIMPGDHVFTKRMGTEYRGVFVYR